MVYTHALRACRFGDKGSSPFSGTNLTLIFILFRAWENLECVRGKYKKYTY